MGCSWSSQSFGRRRQEDIQAEFRNGVKVQVGTRNGDRWQSSGLVLHDDIPIVPLDESVQSWYLERDENSPLWSFYTNSTGGDNLYVTYNEGDPHVQKVSLEHDRSGEKSSSRKFTLLLQPDGTYAIAAPSSLDRLLSVNNGVLVLTDEVDEDHPTEDQDWIIAIDPMALTDVLNQTTTSHVQIQDAGSPSKWISTNACDGNRVSVGTSSKVEEWIVSGTASATTIKVKDFYASRDESEILFETNTQRNGNLRKFKLINDPKAPAHAKLIQTTSSGGWYAGTENSLLKLEKDKSQATNWIFTTTNFVSTSSDDDKEVIFPIFVDSPTTQPRKTCCCNP